MLMVQRLLYTRSSAFDLRIVYIINDTYHLRLFDSVDNFGTWDASVNGTIENSVAAVWRLKARWTFQDWSEIRVVHETHLLVHVPSMWSLLRCAAQSVLSESSLQEVLVHSRENRTTMPVTFCLHVCSCYTRMQQLVFEKLNSVLPHFFIAILSKVCVLFSFPRIRYKINRN